MSVQNGFGRQFVFVRFLAAKVAQAILPVITIRQNDHDLATGNPHELTEREPDVVGVLENIERNDAIERVVRVDGERLAVLMMEHEVGVTLRPLKVPKLDSDYLEE